jgi:hypothetical protein
MFLFDVITSSINLAICDYIINEMTNEIYITDNMFFDYIVSFFIMSIIILLMESDFEHQRNIPSVFCYIIVVKV